MRLPFARTRTWLTSSLRRAFLPAVLPIVLSGFALPTDAADDSAGDVVAVVNADPISRKDLADATLRRYGSDMLESLINRHLILQACKEQGIEVTSEDVRAEIKRMAEKFRLSMQSYLQLLQDERDISPNEYSREIVWPMLALRRLVADKIKVSDEEFKRAFEAEYGEAVKCRMIMVASRDTADSLQQRAAKNPDEFASLAKKFSEDETSASMGGLIPPIRHHTGDPRLEEAAFALQDGDVSPVLQLGDQWLILQAVRRIPASRPSPEAIETVRQDITDRIRDRKMKSAATELFQELQNRSEIVTVFGDEAAMKEHPGVAAIVNGQQVSISMLAAECVKRHGGTVLRGEINRKLLTQSLRKAGKQVTQQDIDDEIAAAAVRYGYVRGDGTPDVDAWIKSVTSDGNTTRELYVLDTVWPSVALKKLVQDDVVVTEEDIEEGYESAFGPRAEVLAIVLADQRTAQKVWDMARGNPTDRFFGQLASQYSVEPVSASNFGKVPPIRKHGGQPALEREAFNLKPGELSGIVATGDKYVVLRCQGFTEPIVKDFDAVRGELTRDLRDKKVTVAMAKKMDQLMKSSQIDNFFAVEKSIAGRSQPGGDSAVRR